MDPHAPSLHRANRDRIFVRSLAWIASARWISQLFRWLATIAMAKLLLPDDYGIVGMAAVLVGLINQIAEFGLGAAVVQHRDLARVTEGRLAGVAVVVALGMALLTCALTPLVARFFAEDALLLVLPAMSLRYPLDALGSIPRGVMARELRFKQVALIEGLESLVMAAVGLGVAFATGSYWALVAANLAGGVTLAAAANAYVPILPRWPGALADLRPLLTFGRDLVLSRIAWYAYSNADFVVVGRLLGAGALGAYSLAWNIASAPAEKLGGMVISVAPAILSEARSQAGEVRRLFLGMVQGVSLVVFPLSVGLAVVAEPLVYTVLGAKWAAAVTPLRLLSLALMFRSLAAIDPVVLIARRETHIDRNLMLLFAIVTPLLFVAGAQWGMGGVAAVWLFAVPALSLPLQRRYIWRSIDVSWADWTRAIWPAASSAALMAVAAGAVGAADPFENPAATMALQIAVGAVAYPAVLWIAHRSAASALRRVIDLRPRVAEPRVLRTDPV